MRCAAGPFRKAWCGATARVLGFVLITQVRETSTYLDPAGVGRMIEVEIAVESADAPAASSLFEQLFSLFS